MSRVAVVTNASLDYAAQVHVLAASVKEHHPEVDVFAHFTAARKDMPQSQDFHGLSMDDDSIADGYDRLFLVSRKEFIVSIKPELLLYVLNQGYDGVLYLDADMRLLAPIHDILDEVCSRPMSLTPHLHDPSCFNDRFTARDLLLKGIYNAGFVGASRDLLEQGFLEWWSQRLKSHCREELTKGMHYDQRWLDMAPAYVDGLGVIRDPGINTSYWNLHELNEMDGNPACRLFHFSGFDSQNPRQLTSYHPGLLVEEHPLTATLYPDYCSRLKDVGHEEARSIPWPWGSFSNGLPIGPRHRRRYLEVKAAGMKFSNPFDHKGFLRWLNGPASIPYRCRRRLRRWFGKSI